MLDLTRLLPGAFCTLLLADMGADVVKVEEPGAGDYMRWTPPVVAGQSTLFNALSGASVTSWRSPNCTSRSSSAGSR